MRRKRYVSCDQMILGPDGNIDACFNGKRDGWIECEAVKKVGNRFPLPETTGRIEQATYDPAEHITKQWLETWLHSVNIFLADNSKAIGASTQKPADHATSPVPVTPVSSPVVRTPSSSTTPYSLPTQQNIATSASPHHVKLETASPSLDGGSDQPLTSRASPLATSLNVVTRSAFDLQQQQPTPNVRDNGCSPLIQLDNQDALNQIYNRQTFNRDNNKTSGLAAEGRVPVQNLCASSDHKITNTPTPYNQLSHNDQQGPKAANGWKQGTIKIEYQGTNCNATGQSAQGHATVERFSKKRSHDMMSGNTRLIDGPSIVNGSPAQMRAEAHMHH
ncbi:hypothetical protein SCUP515_11264 [Seiridium cupressi]